MRTKRFLAVILCIVTVICSLQITAFAADPTVVELGGERTAFVSSFGKMNYEGKNYVAFRTFDEALGALGNDGGTVIFNGTITLTDFKDTEGRGSVTIKGSGAVANRNIIAFTGSEAPATEINLSGPIAFDFMSLKLDAGAYILTNGNPFMTGINYVPYMEDHWSPQGTTRTYPNPPSVAPGKVDGVAGKISLPAGMFETVSAGSARGALVNGDTTVVISGAQVNTVIAGNAENGTMNGDANVTVDGGTVTKLIAGSAAGTLNGNSVTTISASANDSVSEIVLGAQDGATINGGAILKLRTNYTGKISAGAGKVNGKKIVILSPGVTANIPNGVADHIITTNDANISVKDGKLLITDIFGLPATSITVNGSNMSSSDGTYNIPSGKCTIEVPSALKVELDRAAKYVAGYEDGTFRPQNNMTKAEAITLLTRTIIDETKIGNIPCTYEGVSPDAWYYHYIGLFQNLGFLDLLADNVGTSFSPDEKITRAEFTQLIYKIATFNTENKDKGSSVTKLFSVEDVTSKSEFYPAVSYAMTYGIVTGYEDGTFRPDNSITRAEVVTMVNRFLGRTPIDGADGASFGDIDGHWAKAQVVAACGAEGSAWTPKDNSGKYVLTGTTSKEYVYGLYDQSKNLSGQAILDGIDVISEQMKKDILSTPNTQDLYADRMTGTTYYISEKNGDDSNPGTSPDQPLKTIAGMQAKIRFPKKGTSFLFERGGVYRGTIGVFPGTTYGAYGEGEKPVLMQSKKNYADPSLWVETEWENVWKCTDKLLNVGIIAFDHDIFDHSESTYNELLGIPANAQLGGFKGVQDLDTDLQFYSVLENDESNSDSVEEQDLYMYSEKGNPGQRFKSIEIGEHKHIISGATNDIVIDNLAFKFVGGHGISMGTVSDRVITNCVLSYLGGSILSTNFRDSGSPVNFGNAIEVYGGCDGYHVENCWIYQIFDTGVTHQFADNASCKQERVRYYGNLIEYCYWSIEIYNSLGNSTMSPKVQYTKDVHISHNVVNKTGYGWGSIGWGAKTPNEGKRWRGGFAYCVSGLAHNEDCLTEYNVFNRCSEYSGYIMYMPPNSNEVDDKNFYIQNAGNLLGRLKEHKETKADYNAAEYIREKLGDKNAVVLIIE